MPPSSQLARALGGGSGAAVGLHWGGRGSRLGGAGWDFNGSSAFGHVGGQGPRAGGEMGTGGPKRALFRPLGCFFSALTPLECHGDAPRCDRTWV